MCAWCTCGAQGLKLETAAPTQAGFWSHLASGRHQQDKSGTREINWHISSLLLPSCITVPLAEATSLWDTRSSQQPRLHTGLLSLLLPGNGDASHTACLAWVLHHFLLVSLILSRSLDVVPLLTLSFESPSLNYNSYQYLVWYKDIKFYHRGQHLSGSSMSYSVKKRFPWSNKFGKCCMFDFPLQESQYILTY